MKILGIDPGTAIVGWSIVEYNEKTQAKQPIAYGHIETEKTKLMSERLEEIYTNITEIIHTYTPTELAIEELFYFKNAKTVISVAQARGVILQTCFHHKITIFEYTPLQIKQSLTGYGRANKKQIQDAVKSVLKLSETPKPDDTADAIAVAICHCNTRTYSQYINQKIYARN